jgi:hypothetical protein
LFAHCIWHDKNSSGTFAGNTSEAAVFFTVSDWNDEFDAIEFGATLGE